MILNIFSCAYLDLCIFSGELALQIFWPLHFKKTSGCLFIIKLQEFLIYSGYKSFVRCMYDKYFLPDCGMSFHFNSSNRAYVLNFNVIATSSIFVFYGFCFFRSHLRNCCSLQGRKDTLLCFFPGRLVLAFTFWFMIHFACLASVLLS